MHVALTGHGEGAVALEPAASVKNGDVKMKFRTE
jgi:hypothetical protein